MFFFLRRIDPFRLEILTFIPTFSSCHFVKHLMTPTDILQHALKEIAGIDEKSFNLSRGSGAKRTLKKVSFTTISDRFASTWVLCSTGYSVPITSMTRPMKRRMCFSFQPTRWLYPFRVSLTRRPATISRKL